MKPISWLRLSFPKPAVPAGRRPASKAVWLVSREGSSVRVPRKDISRDTYIGAMTTPGMRETGRAALQLDASQPALRYCREVWAGRRPPALSDEELVEVLIFSDESSDDKVQASLLPALAAFVVANPSEYRNALRVLFPEHVESFLCAAAACSLNRPMAEAFVASLKRSLEDAWPLTVDGLREIAQVADKYPLIPAGTFTMGSPADEVGRSDNEIPHQVRLATPYYLKKTPVTQGEWQAVMRNNPSRFTTDGPGDDKAAASPVEQVSWFDAVAYCNKLSEQEGLAPYYILSDVQGSPGERGFKAKVTVNPDGAYGYRLPTEAEWERAARGGSQEACYGALEDVAWSGDWHGAPHPVGQKRPNSFGLYDTLGNVYEWTSSWYGTYPSEAVTDPQGPDTGGYRVFRGGSFGSGVHRVRAALRSFGIPSYRGDCIGFRPARSVPPTH